jgi:hypothetical protein
MTKDRQFENVDVMEICDKLKENIQKVNDKNNQLASKLEDLKVQNEKLASKLEDLKVQNENQESDLKDLKVQNENQESDLKAIQDQNEKLASDLKAIHEQNEKKMQPNGADFFESALKDVSPPVSMEFDKQTNFAFNNLSGNDVEVCISNGSDDTYTSIAGAGKGDTKTFPNREGKNLVKIRNPKTFQTHAFVSEPKLIKFKGFLNNRVSGTKENRNADVYYVGFGFTFAKPPAVLVSIMRKEGDHRHVGRVGHFAEIRDVQTHGFWYALVWCRNDGQHESKEGHNIYFTAFLDE